MPTCSASASPADLPCAAPAAWHPNAGPDAPAFLFTQAFERGTWAPKNGEDGVYTLTLTGASAQTVYFSDRPDRIFGTLPMQSFFDAIGFGPNNPPNAALVTQDPDSGDTDTLIIELLNPRYDASNATLTYDARVLADYHEDELAHAATRQQDYAFPASFDRGGLFIDGCPEAIMYCWDGYSTVGTISAKTCFNDDSGICQPCHSFSDVKYWAKACGGQVPEAVSLLNGWGWGIFVQV